MCSICLIVLLRTIKHGSSRKEEGGVERGVTAVGGPLPTLEPRDLSFTALPINLYSCRDDIEGICNIICPFRVAPNCGSTEVELYSPPPLHPSFVLKVSLDQLERLAHVYTNFAETTGTFVRRAHWGK